MATSELHQSSDKVWRRSTRSLENTQRIDDCQVNLHHYSPSLMVNLHHQCCSDSTSHNTLQTTKCHDCSGINSNTTLKLSQNFDS